MVRSTDVETGQGGEAQTCWFLRPATPGPDGWARSISILCPGSPLLRSATFLSVPRRSGCPGSRVTWLVGVWKVPWPSRRGVGVGGTAEEVTRCTMVDRPCLLWAFQGLLLGSLVLLTGLSVKVGGWLVLTPSTEGG